MSKMIEILKNLMAQHGDDAYTLQEKSGVPQPTTQRFLTGKHGEPRSSTVKKWALAYGKTESQLRGDLPIDAFPQMPNDSFKVVKGKNKVPVFGKSMGGLPDRGFTDEGRPVNGHDEYADVYSSDESAFVVRVDGNSMFPKYEQGQYALVEPNTAPEIGDDVIFRCKKGEVMLKRLINLKGLYEFVSYNNKETLRYEKDEIVWMYYVAYPVPSKKIKSRI